MIDNLIIFEILANVNSILREDSIDEGIPLYAKTKFSFQWTKTEIIEEGFRELLFYLFDIDIESELGEIAKDLLDRI